MHYPASKMPKVGTTIFTVMSSLAAKHDAINLSQGFPDFEAPAELRERLAYHMNQHANQYSPMPGMPQLREAIAEKTADCYDVTLNPETEITVTCGATEALMCAISAFVQAGDEVMMFDPAYDSYEPVVELHGGTAIHLPLDGEDFSINWEAVRQAVTAKTRMIILNSPHNPTGATLSEHDLQQLADIVRDTAILILSDEVYEHILFDQRQHHTLLAHEELAPRSLVICSFGKTYHVTGWKLGYCAAPAPLTAEFRKVHQYATFCSMTPAQLGVADFIRSHPQHYRELPEFYQQKRDLFNELMKNSRFRFQPCAGTYFQIMDYSEISDQPDTEFAKWLTIDAGVAAIPVSVFCENPDSFQHKVRFCFAKNDETIRSATDLLRRL